MGFLTYLCVISELIELESSIKTKLEGDVDESTDPEYWQGLLKLLLVFKAKVYLKEFHTKCLHLLMGGYV